MSDPKRSLGHGLLGRVNLTHQANAAFGDWYERLALNLRDAIRSYSEKASATKASPELTNEGVSAELHRLGAAANREVAGLIVPTVDEIMRRLTAAREKLGAGRALHRGDLDQSNVIGERAGAGDVFEAHDVALRCQLVRDHFLSLPNKGPEQRLFLSSLYAPDAEVGPDLVSAYAIDSMPRSVLQPILERLGLKLGELRAQLAAARNPQASALATTWEEIALQTHYNAMAARRALEASVGSPLDTDAREAIDRSVSRLAEAVPGIPQRPAQTTKARAAGAA